MNTEIVVALIVLVGTLVGNLSGILISNRLTNYKIEQLTKKQEEHNKLIDRTYKLEKGQEVHDQRITASESRIKKLEARP
jgi:sortase (surface protein transpeptidase)